ncbi:CG5968, partial [Drosophila busckii]
MPNFNGAIIMHALQLLKTPATLREIIVTIAKNTDLPQNDLLKPVKQTLEMGHRYGYLQKLNGRYFLVPMTFETLMSEMDELTQPLSTSEGSQGTDPPKQKTQKKQEPNMKMLKKPLASEEPNESTTTLMPPQ